MSDDSFFREVDEELRSDRMKSIWQRFGKYLIGLAILIVLATAGFRGYEYWSKSQASKSGDLFLEAITLSNEGELDEALGVLRELEVDGYGSYDVLARMRAATVLADKEDFRGAIAEFVDVGRDNDVPKAIRDVSRVRAAYLLVDHGSYEDVSAQVEVLSGADNPMRHSAREALGLSAWKNGNFSQAVEWFSLIVGDTDAPSNVRQRAEVMLDLMAAAGHDTKQT
ncbi:tetratricopeptide repeat protein [Hoeflea sp. WL0058]|uniref:Tetratricopeptide repeat protein n=1 Tax=Flavimaribacter sediminis TaxID=2865987 RepID=A0AAE3D400_9HYPH|nr:tetratricopeptide repeat protein [Flavimaribacter sediminis]MBW8640236.1 tetratricopeptide repeat protein [Flavimaribacter sediminis]